MHPGAKKIRPCSRCESNRNQAITKNVCPLTFYIHTRAMSHTEIELHQTEEY